MLLSSLALLHREYRHLGRIYPLGSCGHAPGHRRACPFEFPDAAARLRERELQRRNRGGSIAQGRRVFACL